MCPPNTSGHPAMVSALGPVLPLATSYLSLVLANWVLISGDHTDLTLTSN